MKNILGLLISFLVLTSGIREIAKDYDEDYFMVILILSIWSVALITFIHNFLLLV